MDLKFYSFKTCLESIGSVDVDGVHITKDLVEWQPLVSDFAGTCLPIRCLAMSLHATVLTEQTLYAQIKGYSLIGDTLHNLRPCNARKCVDMVT
jgi:hypothetical protein